MSGKQLIHDYLVKQGWKYKGSCNCGGMATLRYNLNTESGEYRLKVRQSTYLLSKPNEKFYKNSNNELKRTVDEIIQKESEVQGVSK